MVVKTRGMAAMRGIASIRIGFVTDVEGNLAYFDRWVQRSEVLRYNSAGQLELTDTQAYFVYGGDVMDRFDGGLRLAFW